VAATFTSTPPLADGRATALPFLEMEGLGEPHHLDLELSLHAFHASRGKVRSADKLQVEAAKFLHLAGLARSKQDPITCGHGSL
jgi:hypothetical protein